MKKEQPSVLWLSICEGMDRERKELREKISKQRMLKTLKSLGWNEDEVEFK